MEYWNGGTMPVSESVGACCALLRPAVILSFQFSSCRQLYRKSNALSRTGETGEKIEKKKSRKNGILEHRRVGMGWSSLLLRIY